MNRQVRWSETAFAALEEQIAYVATRSPSAAARIVDILDAAASTLGEMPTGRPGRMTGTYEKSVTGLPYILSYAIDGDAVVILHVVHTARDWPDEGWPR